MSALGILLKLLIFRLATVTLLCLLVRWTCPACRGECQCSVCKPRPKGEAGADAEKKAGGEDGKTKKSKKKSRKSGGERPDRSKLLHPILLSAVSAFQLANPIPASNRKGNPFWRRDPPPVKGPGSNQRKQTLAMALPGKQGAGSAGAGVAGLGLGGLRASPVTVASEDALAASAASQRVAERAGQPDPDSTEAFEAWQIETKSFLQQLLIKEVSQNFPLLVAQ